MHHPADRITHMIARVETRCRHYMGLLVPISSTDSFICTIPQTGQHIPRPFLHQSWGTGWNDQTPNGSPMKDRSDDPSHHEQTLLPRSYSCGMMYIKEPLLLIGENSLCGGSGFHLSPSDRILSDAI